MADEAVLRDWCRVGTTAAERLGGPVSVSVTGDGENAPDLRMLIRELKDWL